MMHKNHLKQTITEALRTRYKSLNMPSLSDTVGDVLDQIEKEGYELNLNPYARMARHVAGCMNDADLEEFLELLDTDAEHEFLNELCKIAAKRMPDKYSQNNADVKS